MSARRATGRLPLRSFYSIAELARAGQVDPRRLRRLLEERGVELLRVGHRMCVPLSEIVAKLKPLWDSVQACEELHHASVAKRTD